MGFKEQVNKDLDVFVNFDEFAGVHLINGQEIEAVIDGDEARGRLRQPVEVYHSAAGIYQSELTLFIRTADMPDRPVPGQHFNLDGRLFLVKSCTESMGLITLVLEANDA